MKNINLIFFKKWIPLVLSKYFVSDVEFKEYFFHEIKKYFEKFKSNNFNEEKYLKGQYKYFYYNIFTSNNHKEFDLKNEIVKRDNEIAIYKKKLEKSNNKINEFKNSTSWKVTKPMRNFSKLIKK